VTLAAVCLVLVFDNRGTLGGTEAVNPSNRDLGDLSLSQSPQQNTLIYTIIGTLGIEAHEAEVTVLASRIVFGVFRVAYPIAFYLQHKHIPCPLATDRQCHQQE
jgi:hypothetical protein